MSIFYQDPELRLRDYLHDFSANTWDIGEPVLEMHSHPFTAARTKSYWVTLTLAYSGLGPLYLPKSFPRVMGRNAHGQVVSSSWSKSVGWDLPNDRNQLLSRSARSVYIALYDTKHHKQRGSPRDRRPGFNGSVDHHLMTIS